MGFFKDLGSTLSSALGGVVSSLPGGLVSSGISLLGNTILQNHANNQAQDNAKFWADYNTPVNQMKRLREAGLNPNLVYGNGADSQYAGAPSAPSVGSISSPRIMDAMNFDLAKQEVENKKKQGENLDANTNVANATADKERAIAEGQKLENRKREAEGPEAMGKLNFSYLSQQLKESNQRLANMFTEGSILHVKKEADSFELTLRKKYGLKMAAADYAKRLYENKILNLNAKYAKPKILAEIGLSRSQSNYYLSMVSRNAVLNSLAEDEKGVMQSTAWLNYHNSSLAGVKASNEAIQNSILSLQKSMIEFRNKHKGIDYWFDKLERFSKETRSWVGTFKPGVTVNHENNYGTGQYQFMYNPK